MCTAVSAADSHMGRGRMRPERNVELALQEVKTKTKTTLLHMSPSLPKLLAAGSLPSILFICTKGSPLFV